MTITPNKKRDLQQCRDITIERCIVAAMLPLLCQISLQTVLIWAIAIIAGSIIAREYAIRWVAIGWIVHVLFPGLPFLLVAASGNIARNWQSCIVTASIGVIIFALELPVYRTGLAPLLLGIGCIIAIAWRQHHGTV